MEKDNHSNSSNNSSNNINQTIHNNSDTINNNTNDSSNDDSNRYEWIALMAGPSHFGPELKSGDRFAGQAALAVPFRACTETLENAELLTNRIVIVERGDCTFVQKARAAQKAGAVGVIVCDNTPGSSGEFLPMFAMSGDSLNDIQIPVVFLYTLEFNHLQRALSRNPELNVQIMQMLEFKRLQATAKDSLLALNGSRMETASTNTASMDQVVDKENEKEDEEEDEQANIQRDEKKPSNSSAAFNQTVYADMHLEEENRRTDIKETETTTTNVSSSKAKSKTNDEL